MCVHMQVKATAKSQRQHKNDPGMIGQEEQAATRAQTQEALQDLFRKWEDNMKQASDALDKLRMNIACRGRQPLRIGVEAAT